MSKFLLLFLPLLCTSCINLYYNDDPVDRFICNDVYILNSDQSDKPIDDLYLD